MRNRKLLRRISSYLPETIKKPSGMGQKPKNGEDEDSYTYTGEDNQYGNHLFKEKSPTNQDPNAQEVIDKEKINPTDGTEGGLEESNGAGTKRRDTTQERRPHNGWIPQYTYYTRLQQPMMTTGKTHG